MSRVRSVLSDGDLRVILCLTFDHRAPGDEVSAFKRCVIDCPSVLHSVELTGPYDFMVEASLRDMAEYNEKLASLVGPLAKLVAKYEACFVCKRYVRSEHPDQCIWVPCPEGAQRVDCSLIDKVTAEGDYMRLHSADQSWLVHSTLRTLLERLDPSMFVQLHRSVVVRCNFIDRLIHHGKRWSALLSDGSRQYIAKSHVGAVFDALRIAPTKAEASSTNEIEVNEKIISMAD
jgi:DNA-binding Lrp family transcriptional regulator